MKCPACGRLRLPFHKCPPLELRATVPRPALTAPGELPPHAQAIFEQLRASVATMGLDASRMTMAQVTPASEPSTPNLMTTFCGTLTDRRIQALMREEALLAGGGRIVPAENCMHGTRGYALLYLEWEGLARRTTFSTGPLPMDCYAEFTLTPAGERAREELLTVTSPRSAI